MGVALDVEDGPNHPHREASAEQQQENRAKDRPSDALCSFDVGRMGQMNA